jgi:hypothetical protein
MTTPPKSIPQPQRHNLAKNPARRGIEEPKLSSSSRAQLLCTPEPEGCERPQKVTAAMALAAALADGCRMRMDDEWRKGKLSLLD